MGHIPKLILTTVHNFSGFKNRIAPLAQSTLFGPRHLTGIEIWGQTGLFKTVIYRLFTAKYLVMNTLPDRG